MSEVLGGIDENEPYFEHTPWFGSLLELVEHSQGMQLDTVTKKAIQAYTWVCVMWAEDAAGDIEDFLQAYEEIDRYFCDFILWSGMNIEDFADRESIHEVFCDYLTSRLPVQGALEISKHDYHVVEWSFDHGVFGNALWNLVYLYQTYISTKSWEAYRYEVEKGLTENYFYDATHRQLWEILSQQSPSDQAKLHEIQEQLLQWFHEQDLKEMDAAIIEEMQCSDVTVDISCVEEILEDLGIEPVGKELSLWKKRFTMMYPMYVQAVQYGKKVSKEKGWNTQAWYDI